jgi:hypothetical protein
MLHTFNGNLNMEIRSVATYMATTYGNVNIEITSVAIYMATYSKTTCRLAHFKGGQLHTKVTNAI